jgi:hypothetical protein
MLKQFLLLGFQHGGCRAITRCQPAPTTRTVFLTSNFKNRSLAPETILTATIPTPYVSEPPCAIDFLSLLRGPEAPRPPSIARADRHTLPDATIVYCKRREAQMDE